MKNLLLTGTRDWRTPGYMWSICCLATLLVTGWVSFTTGNEPALATPQAGGETVADDSPTVQRLRDDLQKLASDEWEGRGIGTEGLKLATQFISDTFQAAGLKVDVLNGSPLQHFEITDGAELGEPNSLTFVGPNGESIELTLGKDFQVCSFGGSGTLDAELVFAGYGIMAEDLEFDEYASIDVKDKVVVVMRRNPMQSNPHGPFAVGHGISRHAALTTKLSRAFSQGAKGVLLVNDPFSGRDERQQLEEQVAEAKAKLQQLSKQQGADDDKVSAEKHLAQVKQILAEHNADPLMEFGYGGVRSKSSPPTFHLTQAITNSVLKAALGKDLTEIETQIDATGEPASAPLAGWRVRGEASLNIIRVPVANVIGVIEGSGSLREETIVIGAHFDHLGWGGEGSLAPGVKEIHNGADDNASGTAGLLELARRFAARETPLPRRLVFIAFNGEERGLLGAHHYVDNPLFPLEQTVAMLNMDMIGRLTEDKLTIFGTGTSSVWEPYLAEALEDSAFVITRKPEGFGPSDHSAFYGKKVPVLHFFTGIHDDYHRPSDTWDKLNLSGIEQIVDLVETLAVRAAQAPERPDYIEIQGTSTLARSGSRPYFGSIPDFGKEGTGYAISGVSPGSPADQGGLKGGDMIVELGGQKIGSLDDFDLALRDFKPGEQIEVVVLRAGERVTLQVTLSTPRN